MKETTAKIDRATLLKGGGTVALGALLAGAMETRADACCFPIDLTYGDISSLGLQPTSYVRKPAVRRTGSTGFTAVKIWAPAQNGGGSPQPTAPWILLFTADVGGVKGTDENQHPHGKGTNGSQPVPLGGKIYVYVK